jgi:hypothetical protein
VNWVDPLGLAGVKADCPPNGSGNSTANTNIEPSVVDISRKGAFRDTKRDAGIPMSQQPNPIFDPETQSIRQYKYAKMTDKNKKTILNENGQPIWTREYEYSKQDGSKLIIQDHSAGHYYGEGGVGDQGIHLNIRPIENTRTGKIPGTKEHYQFRK